MTMQVSLLLALNLLQHPAVAPRVMTPSRDYHLPESTTDDIERPISEHSESDTSLCDLYLSPLHNEPVAQWQTEDDVGADIAELFTKVRDQDELYNIIGGTAHAVMSMISASPNLLEIVTAQGTATVSWEDGPSVAVLHIDDASARNPFLIGQSLVDIMRRWYSRQERCDLSIHRRFAAFSDLSDLLTEIQDHPDPNRFQRVYIALRDLFPLSPDEREMGSRYALLYYWLSVIIYYSVIELNFISKYTPTIEASYRI